MKYVILVLLVIVLLIGVSRIVAGQNKYNIRRNSLG